MTGRGFSIGHLFGINIRIAWSWLLIFVLVTWNLTSVLTQLHPTWEPAGRWLLAVTASLLFFASVLAHELAHALVAQAQGVPVRHITLFFLGGVASLQREPPTPRIEFTTAIAGPLMSFALGGILVGLVRANQAFSAGSIGSLAPLHTVVLWLGTVNLLLAVFNMIPGFPLDGGRVLRSVLWGITRNLRKATRWASWLGQAIAWIMISLGVAMLFGVNIPLLGAGMISGVWLVFIGWFLNTASVQSYQQVALHDTLSGISVVRLMQRDLPTVSPDSTLSSVIQIYGAASEDLALPVLDHNALAGIITLEDVRRVPQAQWISMRVEQIMTPLDQLVTISPQEDASEAMNKLIQRDIRQLPVVRENCEFLGLLRRRDIMRWLQLNQEAIG